MAKRAHFPHAAVWLICALAMLTMTTMIYGIANHASAAILILAGSIIGLLVVVVGAVWFAYTDRSPKL